MSEGKPPPSPGDINEQNEKFWARASDELEKLTLKWPDEYADAIALAMSMETSMQCLSAQIGFHDDEQRQAAMMVLLNIVPIASVHAHMCHVEPKRERERQRGRDRANNKREADAYTAIRDHFHAWQQKVAGALGGMDLAEQVDAFCKCATICGGRRLTRHERERMRNLLELWSVLPPPNLA